MSAKGMTRIENPQHARTSPVFWPDLPVSENLTWQQLEHLKLLFSENKKMLKHASVTLSQLKEYFGMSSQGINEILHNWAMAKSNDSDKAMR